jgi:hypothetical protein
MRRINSSEVCDDTTHQRLRGYDFQRIHSARSAITGSTFAARRNPTGKQRGDRKEEHGPAEGQRIIGTDFLDRPA